MNELVYIEVEAILNMHEFDCKCEICTAFVNAPDGRSGLKAANDVYQARLTRTLRSEVPA